MTDIDAGVIKTRIMDFMRDFTLETTPGSSARIPDHRLHLPAGCKVSVTFLPGSDFAHTQATAKRLKDEGFIPMPHFAARAIPSRDFLDDNLRQLQDAGITHAVVLGGGLSQPVGDFTDSMQLLETGLFDRYGFTSIGVAGHPEGSPDIPDAALKQALAWKNGFAERTAAQLYITTQFCFDAAPVIAWDKAINADGNKLPIHIGLPGLATMKTLIGHAKACGVGPSLRVLTRQAKNITKLMRVNAPDRLVVDLAHYAATDPACQITTAHLYPLGGLKRSAHWCKAVVAGDFTLDSAGKGFTVTTHID